MIPKYCTVSCLLSLAKLTEPGFQVMLGSRQNKELFECLVKQTSS